MLTFSDFLNQMATNPVFAVTAALTLAVIFVNGWTDAPNAIATCIATGAMEMNAAIGMAAVCNLAGVLAMARLCPAVTASICNMAEFGTDARAAAIALCAALFSIVTWAVGAWRFGIPTSESHALIAGITGAAVALMGDFSGVDGAQWQKVVWGLFISGVLGFALGAAAQWLTKLLLHHAPQGFFRQAQRAAAAGAAFLHGAQDGQKFMGVFLLGIFLVNGQTATEFSVPMWLMVLCSVVMALGTSIGGYRIIKSVGMDMVKLQPYQGFAADAGATLCLLLSSLTGIPVSTTHTKTTAIMGVGASRRLSAVNWKIVGEMALAWVLTFPGCGLLGFVMAKLFMWIF